MAYATQEILIVLTLGGTAFLTWRRGWPRRVVVLLITVVLSYRQVVHAYPSGGGDYEVAMKNHGQFAALVVASALLVDYVLTVAVSVSAGTDNIISAFPALDQHRVLIAVGLVALLAAANLRGVRESGKTFAVPTYLFISRHHGHDRHRADPVLLHRRRLVAESARVRRSPRSPAYDAPRPAWRCCSSRCARSPPGMHRADRRRGDRQRRAGVQAAEEPERRHHAGADGRHRGDDVRRA